MRSGKADNDWHVFCAATQTDLQVGVQRSSAPSAQTVPEQSAPVTHVLARDCGWMCSNYAYPTIVHPDSVIHKLDILLEEVADALIQFQSDKVVKEVAPYVTDPDSIIFAASILENIKTDLSAQVLKEAYYQVEEIDEKELIIEALCHQFTEVAFPVVNEHMQHPYETSSLVDIEEVVYSF